MCVRTLCALYCCDHTIDNFQVKKKSGYILLTSKAYNARLLTEWLAFCLNDAAKKPRQFVDDRLPLLASCETLVSKFKIYSGPAFAFEMHGSHRTRVYVYIISSVRGLTGVLLDLRTNLARFFGLSERAGRVLTPAEAYAIYSAGYGYCRTYLALARISIRQAVLLRMVCVRMCACFFCQSARTGVSKTCSVYGQNCTRFACIHRSLYSVCLFVVFTVFSCPPR